MVAFPPAVAPEPATVTPVEELQTVFAPRSRRLTLPVLKPAKLVDPDERLAPPSKVISAVPELAMAREPELVQPAALPESRTVALEPVPAATVALLLVTTPPLRIVSVAAPAEP